MTTRKRTYITVFGVNHESADLSARQEFYLSENEYKQLLEKFSTHNIENVFVLNTCNRTEMYTMSDSLQDVINIYRQVKQMDNEQLHNYTFVKYDKEALQHFFNVGSGLKSKILGDYQVIGQMRTAFNEAKNYGLIHTVFERLFQGLFAASKEISNKTTFNQGSASHGYQVANLLNEIKPVNSKVLIIGAGDMAQKTINHLLDYTSANVTIANRTYSKLFAYNGRERIKTIHLENLAYHIQQSDVVISTIPLDNYLNAEQVAQFESKVIFDLTVPASIAPLFSDLEHKVFDIDAIEEHTQKTLSARAGAIPQVEQIVEKHIQNYYRWRNANNQNQVFRLFENELEQFIQKHKQLSTNSNNNLNSQKITELFMKSYYGKLADKRVG